jgi:hypothetical protein
MGKFTSKKKRYRVDPVKRPGEKDGYQIYDTETRTYIGPVYDSLDEAQKACDRANLGSRPS